MIRFFVTGHGRSGTLWLANLLNTDPTVQVHHEPINADRGYSARIYKGLANSMKYLVDRQHTMSEIEASHPNQDYAEVNSYLRYCVPEMLTVWSDIPVAVLVRDGRYTVRSLFVGECYSISNYPRIRPPEVMTPFESCCWYWADAYRRIFNIPVPIYKLEDLNSDWGKFESLCEFLNVKVSSEDWVNFSRFKMNVMITTPLKWDNEKMETFDLLAGDVQSRLGYK